MKISNIHQEWEARQDQGYNAVVSQNTSGQWAHTTFGNDIPKGYEKKPKWFIEEKNNKFYNSQNYHRNRKANEEWKKLQEQGLVFGVADSLLGYAHTRVLKTGEEVPEGYDYIYGYKTENAAQQALNKKIDAVMNPFRDDDPFMGGEDDSYSDPDWEDYFFGDIK